MNITLNNVFLESGYVSLIKHGEELCGDRVYTHTDNECSTIVLSDGLGSGVKANILSTLTSTIIGTMMVNKMPVEDCVETIAKTLPVCKERNLAYSTFTILQVNKTGEIYLIQFDNPLVIMLRNGRNYPYLKEEKKIEGKKIYESKFKAESGDYFILMSDGAINAGVGMALNFGWERENIVKYAERKWKRAMSAKSMAVEISSACNDLYFNMPGDDTTIAVLKVRRRHVVNLMIGPPSNKEDDLDVMKQFFSNDGIKIVCGGTTSGLVSRYLNKPIKAALDYVDKKIPPIAHIEGVDLVTEGVITMGYVLQMAQSYTSEDNPAVMWENKKDGASLIAQYLFDEATDINFYVGKAINPSHQSPDLPININIKLKIIEDITEVLKNLGKKVSIKFY